MLPRLPDNPRHSAQPSLLKLRDVISSRVAAHHAQRAHDGRAGCNARASKKGYAKQSQQLLDSDVRAAYEHMAAL